MAVKVLTPIKGEVNKVTGFAFETQTSTADGFEFVMPRTTEEYVVIVAQNSGNAVANLTLKKPENGSYAAADSDEVFQMVAGGFAQIRIESARYADNAGKVKLVGATADVKVAVLY